MFDFRLPGLKGRLLLAITAALLPHLTVATASAQIRVFDNDLAGWQSAISQIPNAIPTTINFDDIEVPSGARYVILDAEHYATWSGSPSISLIPGDVAAGKFILIHSGNKDEQVPVSPPNAMGVSSPLGATARITFDQPVYGMGGTFLDVEFQGVESTGFDVNGDGVPEVRFANAPGDYSQAFLGFVSDVPVSSVDIHYATTPIRDGDGISVDDLRYAVSGNPQSSILALHEGANDPTTEGWKRERPFAGVSTFPIASDGDYGVSAWAVDDNWSEGLYARDISLDDMTSAMQDGWSLAGTLRIADDATPVGDAITIRMISNAPSPRLFTLGFGSEVDGSPMAQLGVTGSVIDVSLSDLDSGYHTYQLVFDPTSDAAEFLVDGETRFSGYEGGITTGPEADRNFISFGSTWSDGTGQGNYSLVKFEILPGVQPGFGDNLVKNPGFETPEPIGIGLPTSFGDWDGDKSSIVGEENGIQPVDTAMLKFIEGGDGGDVFQYVNVAAFKEQIEKGYVTAHLSFDVNRIEGDAKTDTEFAVGLAAHEGTPASSPLDDKAISRIRNSHISDGDEQTWETIEADLPLPAMTDFLQVTVSAVENVFNNVGPDDFDGHYADSVILTLHLLGDFDDDGQWTAPDIDELSAALRGGSDDPAYDLNRNGVLSGEDRRFWVEELANTYFGDANLDGEFNSTDLVEILQTGEYEDAVAANSTWADGDFSGDGEFDSTDLIVALQVGAYEEGPRLAVAVPEPNGLALALLGTILASWRLRMPRWSICPVGGR